MADIQGAQLLGSEKQLIDTMVALLHNPSSSPNASRYLNQLAIFGNQSVNAPRCILICISDDVRSAFISKGVIPKVTALLANSNSTICMSAMHVLQALAYHGN